MTKHDQSPDAQARTRLYLKPQPRTHSTNWSWQMIGAVGGFAAGMVTLLFGALLSVGAWLAARVEGGGSGAFSQRLATLLLLLTIPLLAFGAHCLDLVDKKSHPATSRTDRRHE